MGWRKWSEHSLQWHGCSPTTAEWKKDPAGQRHYTGTRSNNRSSQKERTCKACGATNRFKVACATCGMRKSYADVVVGNAKPPQALASVSQQNPVRAQL
eukprot:5909442-Alexandrium_andersonii.AAC.1